MSEQENLSMYEVQEQEQAASATGVCPICNSQTQDKCYKYINWYEGEVAQKVFTPLKIYACSNCGFGFSHPFLSEESLDAFYQNEYRSGEANHRLQLLHPRKDSKYGIRGSSQWNLARMFLKDEGVQRILDVGTGAGDALLAAKELFPQAELYAIEPDPDCWPILEKNGIHVFKEAFGSEAAKKIGQTFDLILLSHVLEHFNACDLAKTVGSLQGLLSEDGLCVIEVPLGDLRKYHNDRFYDAPHLSFFTIKSLSKLLEKDFEVVFCRTCGMKYIDLFRHRQKYFKKGGEGFVQKSPGVMWKIKSRLKDFLRPVPFFEGVAEIKKKMTSPTYYDYIKGPYYRYGEDRDFIRAVIKRK